MEKLQGPINPCLISEDLEVGNWLEEFISTTAAAATTTNLKFEDPYNNNDEGILPGAYYYNNNNNNVEPQYYNLPSLEDKMPFLQMLQTIDTSQQQFMQFEPNFQLLLRLQHQKIMDLHSQGVKSETDNTNNVPKFSTEDEVDPPKCNSISKRNNNNNNNNNNLLKKKRKRSSSRPVKNNEEVETQRMTHIAVERNRRRQMNEHLNALRSLMPPSYVQRGDQASIIGGAIDFVKELEQMLQSLQAQKKMRQCDEKGDVSGSNNSSTCSSSNLYSSNVFMDSPPFHRLRNRVNSLEDGDGNRNGNIEESFAKKSSTNDQEHSAENRSALADIEVVVIQNHVNLKIQCQRRPGQLLKAIVAFEELRLTVLHLNITSLHTLVHYSFNLKIEDDCNLGSADEVARAVHQIFSFINLD